MDQEFLKRLLATFRIESEEHVSSMSMSLIELEGVKGQERSAEITEGLYREAHSLKGAARAVGIMEIEAVCRTLETVFSGLKKGSVLHSRELFNLVHRLINLISNFTSGVSEEEKVGYFSEYDLIVRELNVIFEGAPDAPQLEEAPISKLNTPKNELVSSASAGMDKVDEKKETQTVRLPVVLMDSLLLKVEDLLSLRLSFDHMISDLNELNRKIAEWKRELNNLRLKHESHRTYLGKDSSQRKDILPGSIEKDLAYAASFEEKVGTLSRFSRQHASDLNSKVRMVQDELRSRLMFPASYLLDILPKLVRDLSVELGKEVSLELAGLSVNVDKRVLDELKEPLIHIIRNSIDHGIERPSERLSKGKPSRGKISVGVTNLSGSSIEVTISDDGKGIDKESLKAAALRQGVITEQRAGSMEESEILELIYASGVSSSRTVTDISGRGLGMPIVQETVNRLGGSISVSTGRNKGTTFIISLPVTLTTLRGVIAEASGQFFVIPSGYVERVMRIESKEVKTVENRETMLFNGTPVSLIFLHDLLGLKRKYESKSSLYLSVLMLLSRGRRAALAVDGIINEGEVIFKPFNKQLAKVRNMNGATVLGSGNLAIILNADELLDAIQSGSISASFEASNDEAAGPGSIIVADDSITSRTLLKDILESAGYKVTLAVDGSDALAKIKTGHFDLIVTDVEMPRMNGFDLTRALRQDEKLKNIPVVLVTALENSTDKTRGIDSGADAYVVKSSFDQSNLLEIIKRLI
ncbi:MAG: response regulator [Ignavibacteria bacterium]|jgi:two-component system chemotaxis sensor kinase CheA|nr:response regulator [Ignavibacteria bacterium]MCU7501763.1 response regulator [Ignavibacteria bacterium]MCU7516830.1 response regulator [Ignavibacteria bacterium]